MLTSPLPIPSLLLALATGIEGPGLQTACGWDFLLNSVRPAANGNPTLFRPGESEGSEEGSEEGVEEGSEEGGGNPLRCFVDGTRWL